MIVKLQSSWRFVSSSNEVAVAATATPSPPVTSVCCAAGAPDCSVACLVIPAESLDTNQYSYLLCADSNTFRSREEVVWVARAASVLEPAHHMMVIIINATCGRYVCHCVIEPTANCMPEKKAKGNNFVPCSIYISVCSIAQLFFCNLSLGDKIKRIHHVSSNWLFSLDRQQHQI